MERETEQRQDGTCKDRGMHICNTAQSHSPFLCGLIVTAMDSEGAGSDEHVVEVDEAMDVRAAAAAGGQTPSVDARKKTSALKAVVRTGEDLDWKIKGLKEKTSSVEGRAQTGENNFEKRGTTTEPSSQEGEATHRRRPRGGADDARHGKGRGRQASGGGAIEQGYPMRATPSARAYRLLVKSLLSECCSTLMSPCPKKLCTDKRNRTRTDVGIGRLPHRHVACRVMWRHRMERGEDEWIGKHALRCMRTE